MTDRNIITLDAWKTDNLVNEMMHLDFNTYLADDILVKVDRASMACSLETRAPLLDHSIIEFANSLPLNQKIRNGRGKIILRDLLGTYIPKELFERPKSGFMPPLKDWLRHDLRDWAEDLLSPQNLPTYISKEVVNKTWNEHLSRKSDWTQQIWSILMLQNWLRR